MFVNDLRSVIIYIKLRFLYIRDGTSVHRAHRLNQNIHQTIRINLELNQLRIN